MRRTAVIAAALCLAATVTGAQDAARVLAAYQKSFRDASLEVKLSLIQDAANGPYAADLGPLYEQALRFVLDNPSGLASDPRYRQIAAVATERAGSFGYAPARDLLIRLYGDDPETGSRVRVVAALGAVGSGFPEVTSALAGFLAAQNALAESGSRADLQVVLALLGALAKLGDASTFAVVFSTYALGSTPETTRLAKEALLSVGGDRRSLASSIIEAGKPREQWLALELALESMDLSDAEQGALAEQALSTALERSAADTAGRADLRQLRYAAVRAIRRMSWTRAAPLVVRHFLLTVDETERDLAPKDVLLQAIAALGVMGTREAATALASRLTRLNVSTEHGGGYDEQVVGSIIEAMASLGDNVAYEPLMYLQQLNYSSSLKKAAREAIGKLKW